MAVRPIDANELLKKFAYSPADTEDEQVFNAAARKIIREMPTLTPPDEPLTPEQVAEILAEQCGDECACNLNGNDEWLPSVCQYADVCPDPPEYLGCWMELLRHKYRRPPEGGEDINVSTKAPGQWVSVEERLPEPGERVIATDGAFVGEGYMNCYGVWCRPNGMRWNMLDSEVTHWIPLPALPDRRPPEGET